MASNFPFFDWQSHKFTSTSVKSLTRHFSLPMRRFLLFANSHWPAIADSWIGLIDSILLSNLPSYFPCAGEYRKRLNTYEYVKMRIEWGKKMVKLQQNGINIMLRHRWTQKFRHQSQILNKWDYFFIFFSRLAVCRTDERKRRNESENVCIGKRSKLKHFVRFRFAWQPNARKMLKSRQSAHVCVLVWLCIASLFLSSHLSILFWLSVASFSRSPGSLRPIQRITFFAPLALLPIESNIIKSCCCCQKKKEK